MAVALLDPLVADPRARRPSGAGVRPVRAAGAPFAVDRVAAPVHDAARGCRSASRRAGEADSPCGRCAEGETAIGQESVVKMWPQKWIGLRLLRALRRPRQRFLPRLRARPRRAARGTTGASSRLRARSPGTRPPSVEEVSGRSTTLRACRAHEPVELLERVHETLRHHGAVETWTANGLPGTFQPRRRPGFSPSSTTRTECRRAPRA